MYADQISDAGQHLSLPVITEIHCSIVHVQCMLHSATFILIWCCPTAQFHALIQYADGMTATTAKTVSTYCLGYTTYCMD